MTAFGNLGAGHDDYIINAEALAYMRQRRLAAHVISRLVEHPDRCFADQAAFLAHLDRLGIISLTVDPDPVKIATEGALWGSIKAHGLLPDTVIVSDDAGQFNVGRHGLCWVHYLEFGFIRRKSATVRSLAKQTHLRLRIRPRSPQLPLKRRRVDEWLPCTDEEEDIPTRFHNASAEDGSSLAVHIDLANGRHYVFYLEPSSPFAKEI